MGITEVYRINLLFTAINKPLVSKTSGFVVSYDLYSQKD